MTNPPRRAPRATAALRKCTLLAFTCEEMLVRAPSVRARKAEVRSRHPQLSIEHVSARAVETAELVRPSPVRRVRVRQASLQWHHGRSTRLAIVALTASVFWRPGLQGAALLLHPLRRRRLRCR
jgi:hypothetical protein